MKPESLAQLEQAKLDAEIAYDMFYALYNNAQLRAMTDAEFEMWKSEAFRWWSASIDAQRAYYCALDAQERAS